MNRSQQALEEMNTPELIRHTLEEVKRLAKAEVLHAKQELKDELRAVKRAAVVLGIGGALGVSALTLFLAALALALPVALWVGALLIGLAAFVVAALVVSVGMSLLPKKALPKTQESLKADLMLARERYP